jgi:hypothetical protein
VQALDDEAYQTLLRAYPNHLRLLADRHHQQQQRKSN